MPIITRDVNDTEDRSFTIDATVADCTEIPYERFAHGAVYIAASNTSLTTLTWHSAENEGGTFLPAYDKNGTAVTQTVDGANGGVYPIPEALSGCSVLKCQGNVDATQTNYILTKG